MLVTEQSFGNTAQEFYKQPVSKTDLRSKEFAVEKATEEQSPLFKAEDKPLG